MNFIHFFHLKADNLLRKAIIVFLLLGLQVIAAIPGYQILNTGRAMPGGTLSITPEKWADIIYFGDPGGYLGIANSLASGNGFGRSCNGCFPPQYKPTNYWGPGAPLAFASAIWVGKVFGCTNMMPLFFFAFFAECVTSLFLVGLVSNYSKNFFVLLIAAFFNGYCPPTQNFDYSHMITSSEIVTAIAIALSYFYLSRSFIDFWKSPGFSKINFVLAGFSLGYAAITRESNFQFVYFTIIVFLMQVYFRKKAKIKQAAFACLFFFLAAYAPRLTTQIWNKMRTGDFTVSSVGPGADPRGYFFGKYDPTPSFLNSIGFAVGDYLDPNISAKVNQVYADGHGTPLIVYQNYALAIIKHPLKYLKFRTERVPVLFFGTDKWPHIEIQYFNTWTILLYLIFTFYLFYMIGYRKRWPPEVTYYYFFFILAALYTIMLTEFRYSFPALLAIRTVPALFVATLLKDYFKIDSMESN